MDAHRNLKLDLSYMEMHYISQPIPITVSQQRALPHPPRKITLPGTFNRSIIHTNSLSIIFSNSICPFKPLLLESYVKPLLLLA